MRCFTDSIAAGLSPCRILDTTFTATSLPLAWSNPRNTCPNVPLPRSSPRTSVDGNGPLDNSEGVVTDCLFGKGSTAMAEARMGVKLRAFLCIVDFKAERHLESVPNVCLLIGRHKNLWTKRPSRLRTCVAAAVGTLDTRTRISRNRTNAHRRRTNAHRRHDATFDDKTSRKTTADVFGKTDRVWPRSWRGDCSIFDTTHERCGRFYSAAVKRHIIKGNRFWIESTSSRCTCMGSTELDLGKRERDRSLLSMRRSICLCSAVGCRTDWVTQSTMCPFSGGQLVRCVNGWRFVFRDIEKIVNGPSVDLIEHLAETMCYRLLEGYPLIQRIQITIKKPDAPLPLPTDSFDYVGMSQVCSLFRSLWLLV